MPLIESMVEELFQKQFRYLNGRYTIQSPLTPPQRMQWIGSPHCAIIFQRMREKFGADYFIEDYCAGKLYGHMFCPAIGQFTSIQKFIVPMLTLIVKRFGWGRINPTITEYDKNEYRYDFEDSPLAREVSKLYGKQKTPVDSMIAGLVAGSMEHIMQKKLTAIEVSCLAKGDKVCTFAVVEPASADAVVRKLKDEHMQLAKAILETEAKHNFLKEAEALVKGQNKTAVDNERIFLKS